MVPIAVGLGAFALPGRESKGKDTHHADGRPLEKGDGNRIRQHDQAKVANGFGPLNRSENAPTPTSRLHHHERLMKRPTGRHIQAPPGSSYL